MVVPCYGRQCLDGILPRRQSDLVPAISLDLLSRLLRGAGTPSHRSGANSRGPERTGIRQRDSKSPLPSEECGCGSLTLQQSICVSSVADNGALKKLWCWIGDKWNSLRIFTYYIPIWVCILLSTIIYFAVGYQVFHQRNQLRNLTLSNPAKDTSSSDVRESDERVSPAFCHCLSSPLPLHNNALCRQRERSCICTSYVPPLLSRTLSVAPLLCVPPFPRLVAISKPLSPSFRQPTTANRAATAW